MIHQQIGCSSIVNNSNVCNSVSTNNRVTSTNHSSNGSGTMECLGDDETGEPPNIRGSEQDRSDQNDFKHLMIQSFKSVPCSDPEKNTPNDNCIDEEVLGFDFDRYLQKTLGEFGRFQRYVVCLLCVPACFLSAYSTLDMVFMAYTPNHTCNVTISHQNYLYSSSSSSSPSSSSLQNNLADVNWQFSDIETCSYKATPFYNGSTKINSSTETFRCLVFDYDTTYFRSTLVTQFNLVCDKAITIRTILSLLNISVLFAVIYTYIGDRLGRKTAFFANLTVFLVGSCSSLLARSPLVFGILKLVGGITCMWEVCYCWAVEFIGPSQRTTVTTVMSVVYCIATMSLALLAYVCDTWVEMGLCTTTPFALLYLYIILVPESPRWLLTQGRIDEALKVIETMARWQKVKIDLVALKSEILAANAVQTSDNNPNKMYAQSSTITVVSSTDSTVALLNKTGLVQTDNVIEPNPELVHQPPVVVVVDHRVVVAHQSNSSSNESLSATSVSVSEMFANSNLRWKIIFISCIETISGQLYYAVPYSIERFSTNFYISYGLQAAVEAPATLLNLVLLNRYGRIVPLSTSLFLSSFCCLLTLMIGDSSSLEWVSVALIIASRFFICTGVAIIEQLGGELFPTVVRGTGQGISYFVSAVASISTQYIIYASHVWDKLPMLIFGITVLVVAGMSLFLPETMGRSLPDTIRQAEAQGSVGLQSFRQNVPKLVACCRRSYVAAARSGRGRRPTYKLDVQLNPNAQFVVAKV